MSKRIDMMSEDELEALTERVFDTEPVKPNGYRAHGWEDKDGHRFALVGITLDPESFAKALAVWDSALPEGAPEDEVPGRYAWFTNDEDDDPEAPAYIALVSADDADIFRIEIQAKMIEMRDSLEAKMGRVPEDMRFLPITSSDVADEIRMIEVPFPDMTVAATA